MIERLQAILAEEATPETIAAAAILGGVLAGLALIALAVLLWRTRKRPDPQAPSHSATA